MTIMNLKNMRREAGFTQVNVADTLGVLQSSISYWERGIYEPSALQIAALASLYQTTADEIIQAIRAVKESA